MRTRAVFLAVFASFAFSFAPSAHAAAPARMEDLITQYDADESAVGQFYDLPWSAVRFDRLDKLYSAWLAKLATLAVALALFEVSTAKMRVFRVPEFLGVALLLGLLSAIFLFVAGRLGG